MRPFDKYLANEEGGGDISHICQLYNWKRNVACTRVVMQYTTIISPPLLRLKENLVALCNFSRREKLLFESHLEQKYPVGGKICRKFARNWHMMFRRPERIPKRIYLFRVFNIRDRRISLCRKNIMSQFRRME